MRTIEGTLSKQIKNPFLGIITKDSKPLFKRSNYIYLADEIKCKNPFFYKAVVATNNSRIKGCCTELHVDGQELKNIQEGDVVLISSDASMKVLWEKDSHFNALLITDACNCRCIMCPQPPSPETMDRHKLNVKMLNLIKDSEVKNVCFTGGEPTLFPDRLFELFKLVREYFPKAKSVLLTNGVNFHDFDLTKKIVQHVPDNTMICVSLNADVSELHDKITGLNGGFNKVIKGLHNLAKCKQPVEVRFVITKLNHDRMPSFAEFIYRNFPFIAHLAFMGMEVTGYARDNYKSVWIDPVDYVDHLKEAVVNNHRRGMNVSIYNVPLCLLPRSLYKFARKSISSWKNKFLDVCRDCSVKGDCCGVFETSGNFQSPNIKAI